MTRADLEAALEAAEVGIWVWEVATQRVVWSPGLERLFGFERGSFDGTIETYRACIAAEDQERVQAAIQAAVEQGNEYVVTHRAVRRDDGRVLWVECRGRIEVGPDGQPSRMRGTVMDVTVRRETEARLEETDEVTRLLNDLASDYVYSADFTAPTLAPSIVAGSFQRVTSFTPEEVAARGGWFEIIHPEDRAPLLARMAEGVTDRPFISEYRIVTKDGEVRWLRDHARPRLDPDGSIARWVGGVQDITERRRLEEQLRQSQKMEALARLAGGVAHDFNNLLTVIFGGVGLLRRGRGPERDAEAIDAIATSAERAAELTRSLLALGRRQPGASRPLRLVDALLGARSILEGTVGDHAHLEIHHQACTGTVRVDPGQLHLVLLNLAVNARDATPRGGAVKLLARDVELTSSSAARPAELPPGRYVAIDVVDEGVGIPPEVLPRIFEPFFTTKPYGLGTGLGLAISHGVISQAGGTIAVRSSLGRGSTFTVYLPCIADAPDAMASSSTTSFRRGGSESLLLVEDEPRVRSLAARSLRDLGYTVHEAASAEEALALAAKPGLAVALAISDVRLPGMDGLALVRELRVSRPQLRVLLMSGYAPDGASFSELSAGELPFLSKPFTPDGLASRVRETLDGSAAGAT